MQTRWRLLTDQPLPPEERWIRDEAERWHELPFTGSIAEKHAVWFDMRRTPT